MPNLMISEDYAVSNVAETICSGGRLVTADGQHLPLRSTGIEARAGGGIARVTLRQRFVNDLAAPMLVRYQLPLPADGAVSGFSFTIGDRTIHGEVDTSGQARERFEQALVDGVTAGLLEQRRSNQFDQSIGNLPPGADIVCEVIVDQKLAWLPEGAWEWRFPTVLGARYSGQPGRVADAAELNVPFEKDGISTRASFELCIDDTLRDGATVTSPSHNIGSHTAGESVGVACHNARLDRDIVVRWPVAKDGVDAGILCVRPIDARHDGERAYGLLTLVPPIPASGTQVLPRDMVFLIDTSGSMHGAPLDQAVRIASTLVDSLSATDRLEMIAFGSRPNRWQRRAVSATNRSKQGAKRWLRALGASGATEMRDAIEEALRPLRDDAQRQVVLITDGFIGFEHEIVETLLHRLPTHSRLHTVGVGSAPNRSLTGPAARAGRGIEVVVGVDEDVGSATERLLVRTRAPVMTDLVIEGDGFEAVPSRLPDLYADSPVSISLLLPVSGGDLYVRGTSATGHYECQLAIPRTVRGDGHPAVAALYGREAIEDLEMRRAVATAADEIDADIERIALKFQLSSRLTSWIAIDSEQSTDGERELVEAVVPHEIPYGTSIEGFGLRGLPGGLEPMGTSFGAPLGAPPVAAMNAQTGMARRRTRRAHYKAPRLDHRPAGKAGDPAEPRPRRDTSTPPSAQPDSVGKDAQKRGGPILWRRIAWAIAVVLAIVLLAILLSGAVDAPIVTGEAVQSGLTDHLAEPVRP